MDGGDIMDNGYHSNDDTENGDVPENMEVHMLEDMEYDAAETRLMEPDYNEVRKQRFRRNRDVMKSINAHITDSLIEKEDAEMLSIEEAAATIIQKHVRSFLAQRKYVEMLMQQFEKEEKLRREKTMEQVEEAKLLVENHQLEVQFEDYNVVRRNRAHRLVFYAIAIQRAWRKYKSAKFEGYGNTKQNGKLEKDTSLTQEEYHRTACTLVEEIIQNALIIHSSQDIVYTTP